MDCGTVSNLFTRFACIMNGTRVDEYFGFGVLVFIGVAGTAMLLRTLIKNWNAPSAKEPEPPNAGSGSE